MARDYSAEMKKYAPGSKEYNDLALLRMSAINTDPTKAKYKGDTLYNEGLALQNLQQSNPVAALGTSPSPAVVTRPSASTAQELASRFGNINYDTNAIKGIFDEATQKEYAAKNKAYGATENTFYNNLANTGSLAQDTIRKNTAQAITTGASRGMQAATELSALLGLQQAGVQGATDLGVQRNLLTEQEQAAMSLNASNALKQGTDTQLALGKMSGDIYAADTQFSVGEMSAQAQADLAMKQLQAAGITASANRYGAEQGRAGQIGYGSEVARGQIEGSRLSAEAQKAAAGISANAAVRSAGISAAAYKPAVQNTAPTLQSLVADAMAKGQPGIAASLIMQATGMSYEDALKVVRGEKALPAGTPKPKQNFQGEYVPSFVPNTPAWENPTLVTPNPSGVPTTMGGAISFKR